MTSPRTSLPDPTVLTQKPGFASAHGGPSGLTLTLEKPEAEATLTLGNPVPMRASGSSDKANCVRIMKARPALFSPTPC